MKQKNLNMTGFASQDKPWLKYYTDEIDARVLIPVHGNNPERLFAKEGRQRLLPKKYQTYILENNQLVEVDE